MRDWKLWHVHTLWALLHHSKPTYEGLKVFHHEANGCIPVDSKPTYEGLKAGQEVPWSEGGCKFKAYLWGIERRTARTAVPVLPNSKPTYEGLKGPRQGLAGLLTHYSKPTYEGLKAKSICKSSINSLIWFKAYLWGIESFGCWKSFHR